MRATWCAPPRVAELQDIYARAIKCFEAGAIATGAAMTLAGGDRPYAEVTHHPQLAEHYRENGGALGRRFSDDDPTFAHFLASTDMGNVSAVVPSIHPFFGLGAWPVVNHQPEFADFCATPAADDAMIAAATALAWTAIDAAVDGPLRDSLLQQSPSQTAE